VEVDSRDKSDRSPLFWAARNKHKGVVKLLLRAGKVDVDARDKMISLHFSGWRRTDMSGETAA